MQLSIGYAIQRDATGKADVSLSRLFCDTPCEANHNFSELRLDRGCHIHVKTCTVISRRAHRLSKHAG